MVGAFFYLCLYLFFGAFAALVLPLAIGLYAAIWLNKKEAAATAAGLAVFIGHTGASLWLTQSNYPTLLQRLPDFANRDVVGILYTEIIYRVIQANFLTGLDFYPQLILALIMAAGAAGAAYAARGLVGPGRTKEGLLAIALLVIVLANLVFVATDASATFRRRLAVEPENERYAYDGVINLKAYYLMKQGMGYYQAVVVAAKNDSRISTMQAAKDFYRTPIGVRAPTSLYFLKVFTSDGGQIVYWALFFAGAAIVALFMGAQSALGVRYAAIVPLALYPFYLTATTWHNILLQTWWASLFTMICIGLWAQKKYWPAAAVALIAAATRETAMVLPAVGFVVGVVLRDRRIYWPFFLSGCLGLLFYLVHYQQAAVYITSRQLASFLVGPQLDQVLGATAYLLFPYGWFFTPSLGLMIFTVGYAGLFFVEDKPLKIFLTVYVGVMIVWILNSLVSSYWGTLFNPIILISLAAAAHGIFSALGKMFRDSGLTS